MRFLFYSTRVRIDDSTLPKKHHDLFDCLPFATLVYCTLRSGGKKNCRSRAHAYVWSGQTFMARVMTYTYTRDRHAKTGRCVPRVVPRESLARDSPRLRHCRGQVRVRRMIISLYPVGCVTNGPVRPRDTNGDIIRDVFLLTQQWPDYKTDVSKRRWKR